MNLFSLGAVDWFREVYYQLMLFLNGGIYRFIGWLYEVFDKIARVNLFSTEVFEAITGRIYVVMGIAMLFIFAYNIILMIIDPDSKKSTGSTTKIVKETIISLVVIVLLPTIFNWMYTIQNHILSTNIIGQVILGNTGSTGDASTCKETDWECKCDFSEFEELKNYTIGEDRNAIWPGFSEESTNVLDYITDKCKKYRSNKFTDSQRGAYSIAPTIFSAFYRPATFNMGDCTNFLLGGSDSIFKKEPETEKKICANFFFDIYTSKYIGDMKPFVNDGYLMLILSTGEGYIEFDEIFALVAGGLAVWMFLCYSMEIGVRVAKLGVLQIISPIAVMMRVVPGQKEKMYTKWFNQLKNTYLDVFIRLIIIFFALFAISLVPDVISTLFSSVYDGSANLFIETIALVIVILGILKFAQEAPNLIKEFFGDSGRFSLKSPKKQLSENKLAMGGVNALKGGIYGATTGSGAGRIRDFFGGAARGAVGGYDKAVKGLDTIRTERANGSTFGGRMLDRARTSIGMETIGEKDERSLEKKFKTKERTESNEKIQKYIDKIKSTADGNIEKISSKAHLGLVYKDEKGNEKVIRKEDGFNYASLLRMKDAMQNDVENEKDEKKRFALQQKVQSFSIALEDAKKAKSTEVVSSAFSGGDADGLLNAADIEAILSARREINNEIKSTKSVGVQINENGKRIEGTAWTDEITTDAKQLFGGKDSKGNNIANLRDTLTSQRANISERASSVRGSTKYHSHQANSRMVRGQGKAEKK